MRARTRFLSLLMLPILSLAVACGDDDDEDVLAPEPAVEGTYALVGVNGAGLPFLLAQEGTDTTELTSAQIVLTAGGTCEASATVRSVTAAGTSSDTETDSCTWTKSGDAMQFTWGAQTTSATWTGDQLTLTDEGWESVPLEEPTSLVFER